MKRLGTPSVYTNEDVPQNLCNFLPYKGFFEKASVQPFYNSILMQEVLVQYS